MYRCSRIAHCDPVGQKNPPLLQRQAFRAVFYLVEYQMISKPWAWNPPLLDELTKYWRKGICLSHPQPLLEKVKTAGQGCDFHRSSAAIQGTPSCVFVMRRILLTKGLLQAHSAREKKVLEICTKYVPYLLLFRTFSLPLENNDTLKCSSDNFPL